MTSLVHDPDVLHLGKHLGVVEDPRTLRLARYIDLKKLLPQAPSTISYPRGVGYAMYANDRYGDCTCAGIGNYLRAATRGKVEVGDGDVLAAYSAITGFDQSTGANDNGAYEVDVLNYWRKTGVGGHQIKAWARIDLRKHDLVAAACWLFGGVYIGLALPVTAQHQKVWDAPTGKLVGDAAPGSWGGHCVVVEAINKTGPGLVTWGEKKQATWKFWDGYCDEAYGVVSLDWLSYHKGHPRGFNEAALDADLAQFA